MTIFVSIASYRDPELVPTLADCVAKAAHPGDLRFGICWQHDGSESLGAFADDPRCRVIEVPHSESLGCCWARHQNLALYDGEDFTLSLDAHHRFVEGWDAELIAMMDQTGSPKPILTTYPPAFDPGAGTFEESPRTMAFMGFDPRGPVSVRPHRLDPAVPLDGPIASRFYAGGFAFSQGRIVADVPHDPNLYFLGEEANMTVRAFTHGYDLFHPDKVICWHYYERADQPKHWHDHKGSGESATSWEVREERGLARLRRLLGIDPTDKGEDFGRYGLGTARTLRDYEIYAGLSFRHHAVADETLQHRPPPTPNPYDNESDWLDSLVRSRRFEVTFSRAESEALAALPACRVALEDDAGVEICHHDLLASALTPLCDDPAPAFNIQYFSDEPAARWTVRARGAESEKPLMSGPVTA